MTPADRTDNAILTFRCDGCDVAVTVETELTAISDLAAIISNFHDDRHPRQPARPLP